MLSDYMYYFSNRKQQLRSDGQIYSCFETYSIECLFKLLPFLYGVFDIISATERHMLLSVAAQKKMALKCTVILFILNNIAI